MLERVFRLLEEIRHEFKPMLRLALPLALGELGWMAMGIVDTVMVGRLPNAAVAMGAVGLGSLFYWGVTVFGSSILLGMDTLVSQSYGAGNRDDTRRSLWNGIYLAAALTPVMMGLVYLAAALMGPIGVNEAVRPAAQAYTRAVNLGAPTLLMFFALRRYLQAVGAERIVTVAMVSANLINFIGNWALIYGHLGFSPRGILGSALATVVSRWYMAFLLIGYLWWREGIEPRRLEWSRIRKILGLGIPAALHVWLETGIFTLATALIARLSPEQLAAHQITLNVASVTFMVPLGISSAAAVRVGHRAGARDVVGAAHAGYAAIAIGAGFMSLSALTFLTIPRLIARIYTPDTAVIEMTVTLLAVAAVFQLFDGIQITCAGALRGAGDTHTAMFCNLVFYWLVGLPVGYALCFYWGYGAAGLWAGLCLALVCIGIALLAFWRRKVKALMDAVSG